MNDSVSNTIIEGSTSASERSERFEAAFNKIHLKLKQLCAMDGSFVELVGRAQPRYAIIRQYADALRSFAKLRNVIVHEKIKPNYYIAEPHVEIVQQIEKICDQLCDPPVAINIASRNVVAFDATDPLSLVLAEISDTSYSQYPVYKDFKFCKLITADGILKWMHAVVVDGLLDLNGVKLDHIMPYELKQNCRFVSRRTSVFELEELFEDCYHSGNKIDAVLVTENGREQEGVLGIVTAWDLIKIDEDYLDKRLAGY